MAKKPSMFVYFGFKILIFQGVSGVSNPNISGISCQSGQATRCFEPSNGFVGARPGFAFKLGDQGDLVHPVILGER